MGFSGVDFLFKHAVILNVRDAEVFIRVIYDLWSWEVFYYSSSESFGDKGIWLEKLTSLWNIGLFIQLLEEKVQKRFFHLTLLPILTTFFPYLYVC